MRRTSQGGRQRARGRRCARLALGLAAAFAGVTDTTGRPSRHAGARSLGTPAKPTRRGLPLMLVAAAALGACASTTTVHVAPGPQPPACRITASALILWTPQWRPDQKDVAEREAAAASGIAQFFAGPGCFASATVQRIATPSAAAVSAAIERAPARYDGAVLVTVRELGPIVRVGGSAALVEGGTEVVLELAEFEPPAWSEQRRYTVTWRDGGPGVIKGVASLPQDIQAALAAGMQPSAR